MARIGSITNFKNSVSSPPLHAPSARENVPAEPVEGRLRSRSLLRDMQSVAPRQPSPRFSVSQDNLSESLAQGNLTGVTHVVPVAQVERSLKKSDLRPGDILLYVKPSSSLLPIDAGIAFGHFLGKKLQPQINQGEHNIIHAALWTKNPQHLGNTEACGEGEPEVVEAHLGSSKRTHAVIGTALAEGKYLVYRPKDENLGDWASQIAMVWSSERNVPYSLGKVVKAGVKSLTKEGPHFNSVAKARAQAYMNEAFDANPSWKKEGAFCAHIIVAAYQSAFLNMEEFKNIDNFEEADGVDEKLSSIVELNVNASRITPLNLHHLLEKGDAFEKIGNIKMSESDVLYKSP